MDRGSILRVWLPLVAGLIFFRYVFINGPGPRDWIRALGFALALAGFAGVITARYTLGRSFSVTAKATKLVTAGIYSRIRNPIYVCGTVFVAGMILMLRRPALAVLLAVLIPLQILRARREAHVLEAKFGEQYRRYREQTWF